MFKKIISLFIIGFIISSFSTSDTHYKSFGGQFRWSATLAPGEYLFNSTDLYFFDTGVNCYLFNICPDIDSLFQSSAKTITIDEQTEIKYQAYLFTDNYEYLFVEINRQEGWIRTQVPIDQYKKDFLRAFLASRFGEPRRTCYVEVVPFKDPNKVFLSTTDDWYIGDLLNQSITQIGTKGGRLEACRMLFHKNCVECYIDLGWGETLMFDQNGQRCEKRSKTRRR